MIAFDVKDNQLHVRPEDLKCPEIRAVWDADKSPDKKEAQKDLLYVFYLADKDKKRNELLDEDYRELEPMARRSAFGSRDFTIEKGRKARLDAAIQAYKAHNVTADQRLYETVTITIDDIRHMLDSSTLKDEMESIEIEERERRADCEQASKRFVPQSRAEKQARLNHLASEKMKMIDQLEKSCKTRDAIKSRLDTQKENQKNRAGAEESLLESGRVSKHLKNKGARNESAKTIL